MERGEVLPSSLFERRRGEGDDGSDDVGAVRLRRSELRFRELIERPIGARRYLAYGLVLFTLKFLLARLIMSAFGRPREAAYYWIAGSYHKLVSNPAS